MKAVFRQEEQLFFGTRFFYTIVSVNGKEVLSANFFLFERRRGMKSRLLFPVAAGTLVSLLGMSGVNDAVPGKNPERAAVHRYRGEISPGFEDLKVVFADRYRNRNWADLYGMFEEAGAQVFFSDSTDIRPEEYDALVLGGGYDIDPSVYGEKNQGSEDIDLSEDILQMNAARKFADAGKPILGICRGAQLLNVCFGGTLNQDIGGHKGSEREVNVLRRSFFRDVIGDTETVACWHHQSVNKPGDDLVVTMFDDQDLTIEGFEHAYLPVYGLQWHPEGSACGRKIIDSFLRKVKQNKKSLYRSAGDKE